MADPVYDEEKKPASSEPEDLKRQERAAGDDPYKKDWGGQYGSDTPGHYRSDEQRGEDPQDQSAQEHPSQVGKGYRPNKINGQGRFKSLSKRKGLLLAAGGSSLLLIVIGFLAFFLPTLKIPQLAYHIEQYRLVRLTRTFYKQASILVADKAAIDAAGSNAQSLLEKNKTGVKMASLRPQAVINNMKASGILSFETTAGALGAEKITAVKLNINGQERVIEAPKPQLGRPITNYKDRLRFASQLNTGMHDVLRGNNYFIRSQTSKKLLSAWGIQLRWYEIKGAKFLGLSQEKADQLALQETRKKISTTPKEESKISGVNTAAKEANQAIDECLAGPVCAKKIATTGELPVEVTSKIDGIVGRLTSKSAFTGVLSFFNPVYAIGMPTCIVYDGSVQASKAFVNSQNEAAIKTFMAIASADSQQKKGDVTAQAVGAFNRRVGDITDSIPEKLARGQPVDTSFEVSPQAARSGEFSIFDVLFPSGIIANAANSLANSFCPIVTNTEFNIALASALIIAAILSGGAEKGVEAGVTGFISRVSSSIAAKFTTVEGRAAIKNTAKKYAAGTGKFVAATEGATYLARMLVLAEMGAFYNGLGNDELANQADAGAVAYAQEMQRQQLYGRPLTNQEVKVSQAADKVFIAEQKTKQSTFERYFALNNPDSAAASLAMGVSELNMTKIASFFTNIPKVLATIFSPLTNYLRPAVAADTADDNTNYKIVQMGWSVEEENLIDNDPSFDPIENAQIVTDSGQADLIQGKYGKCFSSDIGTLLTDGSVKRDSDGNLQDEGLCSPKYLGPSNAEFGDKMVFRWRLDQSYQSTLDELLSIQNLESNTSSSNPAGTIGPVVSGSTQELAQKILNNSSNISYPLDSQSPNGSTKAVLEALADGKDAPVTCRDGSAGNVTSANINPNILQFLVELGSQTQIGVNALTDKCHSKDSNHYQGKAVDFQCSVGSITFNLAVADSIAAKYGGKHNNESCTKPLPGTAPHWHYDFLVFPEPNSAPSSSNSCAAGSDYVGEQIGYENGTPIKVNLCAINDLSVNDFTPGIEGSESTPGTKYYINGTNNRVLVDATVSKNVVDMVNAAKADGVTLTAFSSFRKHDHQAALAAGGGAYASAGTSRHQRGFAIDFIDSNRNSTANCRNISGHTVNGRCVAPGDPIWEWLNKNASRFGYKQLINESWHWSPDGQ